jgi:hypothetical protein
VLRNRVLGTWRGRVGAVGGAVAALVAFGPTCVVARAALPDGRAYELVSPADKNGYPVFFQGGGFSTGLTAASQDGNSAVYTSWGEFAGSATGMPVTYRSRRTASGWVTAPVSPPPATPDPNAQGPLRTQWADASSDLATGVIKTMDFPEPSDQNNAFDVYAATDASHVGLVSRGNGTERTGAGGADYAGVSADGNNVLFTTDSHLVPEDAGRVAGADLYERIGGQTHLINIAQGGGLVSGCGSLLGGNVPTSTDPSTRNAVSGDGSKVVFQVPNGFGGDPSCSAPAQVYLRVDGTTLHVSAPQRTLGPDPGGAQPAHFQGAAADGSIVYFASTEMLTDDAPSGGGLYAYHTSMHTLDFVNGTNGYSGVVKIADDGSHVYFVSGVLPGHSGDSLYLSENGHLEWVAADPHPSSTMLRSDTAGGPESSHPAYVTPDGLHLAFATSAPLTGYDNLDPNTGVPHKEVFLYSEETNELRCISCDVAGQRPNGSRTVSDAGLSDASPGGQVISDDGKYVVFTTGDQLTPDDTNQHRDVYEYASGRLALISSGRGANGSYLLGISGEGTNVLFATADGLVPLDQDDGNEDIYDARIGGGFPAPPRTGGATCDGDGCQGPAVEPPALPFGSSATFFGSGNAQAVPAPARKTLRVSSITAAAKRRFATSGTVVLTMSVRGGGTISVKAVGKLAGKTRTLGSARHTVGSASAARVRVTLRLSAAARRYLADKRRLPLRIEVRLSGVRAAQVERLTLTRKGA